MNEDTQDRWRLSIHEAGHIHVSLDLFGGRGGAVLTPAGGGLAVNNIHDDGVSPLPYLRAAIFSAAGKVAERLLADWPTPHVEAISHPGGGGEPTTAPLPCPATDAEMTAPDISDDEKIWWCGERLGVPPEMHTLWRRFVCDCAAELVAKHEMKIGTTAMRLFRDGRVVVET
jgi:hypothetical protein